MQFFVGVAQFSIWPSALNLKGGVTLFSLCAHRQKDQPSLYKGKFIFDTLESPEFLLANVT